MMQSKLGELGRPGDYEAVAQARSVASGHPGDASWQHRRVWGFLGRSFAVQR